MYKSKGKSYMTDSAELTFEELLDWIDGRLSSHDETRVEAKMASIHAEDKQVIEDRIAWLQAFVRLRDELNHEPPPPRVRRYLRTQFAEYAQQRATPQQTSNTQPGILRQFIAALTFDSGATVAFAGARTAQTADTRLLTFNTEVADIVINVQSHPHQQKVGINGQLLPLATFSLGTMQVELLLNDEVVANTATNTFGEFSFDAVVRHKYQMKCVTDGLQLMIEVLDLRSD